MKLRLIQRDGLLSPAKTRPSTSERTRHSKSLVANQAAARIESSITSQALVRSVMDEERDSSEACVLELRDRQGRRVLGPWTIFVLHARRAEAPEHLPTPIS